MHALTRIRQLRVCVCAAAAVDARCRRQPTILSVARIDRLAVARQAKLMRRNVQAKHEFAIVAVQTRHDVERVINKHIQIAPPSVARLTYESDAHIQACPSAACDALATIKLATLSTKLVQLERVLHDDDDKMINSTGHDFDITTVCYIISLVAALFRALSKTTSHRQADN